MDAKSTSESEMSPEHLIREHLRQKPLKMSPWQIAHFFENEANVSEEFLDKSLETLAEEAPEFEQHHKEIIEELEKAALLAIPMFRQIQLITLLNIIRETTANTQVFPYLPDFPKPPASRLLDHIFRDNSLSAEEKKIEYEQIAKSTPQVLEHLISWRDHVASFVKGLEEFQTEYHIDLSTEQKTYIDKVLKKSRESIPQIDGKIEQKKIESTREVREFEQFYRVVSKEPRYALVDSRVARSQIQRVFDESDHDLRRIIARMGAENEKVQEESMDVKEQKGTRKRHSDGKLNGILINGTQSSPNNTNQVKKTKTATTTEKEPQNDEEVSVLTSNTF